MRISMLLYPVDDIDTALPLFVDGLGLSVRLRDGGRYCALDGGPLTIALVAGAERIVERAALVLRVDDGDDLGLAVARIVEAGASVRVPVQAGPHETRAVLEDRNGALLVIAQKRSA
ncbi:VOC family protein [Burkholderia sp. FERM BP-3421]|jgi:methyl coenzyme M reductase beta subunit|uniref:VOC family protein n=1 Tax=Burkholderia sp. FERM BP-3421 TaxID=1494466 RepID=UPI00236042DA|nr:VOC family protein [Burkholderia sp. FERM BP-3421]WDD92146.1 VOC family protein [Burkholderia sp. FERM BP-3421]